MEALLAALGTDFIGLGEGGLRRPHLEPADLHGGLEPEGEGHAEHGADGETDGELERARGVEVAGEGRVVDAYDDLGEDVRGADHGALAPDHGGGEHDLLATREDVDVGAHETAFVHEVDEIDHAARGILHGNYIGNLGNPFHEVIGERSGEERDIVHHDGHVRHRLGEHLVVTLDHLLGDRVVVRRGAHEAVAPDPAGILGELDGFLDMARGHPREYGETASGGFLHDVHKVTGLVALEVHELSNARYGEEHLTATVVTEIDDVSHHLRVHTAVIIERG